MPTRVLVLSSIDQVPYFACIAPRFWRTWATRLGAGIAQMVAGCVTMKFSANWAQAAQPISDRIAGVQSFVVEMANPMDPQC